MAAVEARVVRAVIVTLAVGVLTLACGAQADGPPEIAVDRTPCAHCGMLISEPIYAAAYRAPESDARVFDDIRCLLDAAHEEPQADALRFWFHDADTEAWIAGHEAVFVSSRDLRTPMGGGLIAFRNPDVARERAARYPEAHVILSIDALRKKGS